MSEQERERIVREAETDPAVEGHILRRSDEAEPEEDEAGRKKGREGEEPDVEGHIIR